MAVTFTAIGTALGATGATATAVGAVVTLTATTALSYGVAKLTMPNFGDLNRQLSQLGQSGRQINTKEPNAPLEIVYGRVRKGGTIIHQYTSSNGQVLTQVILVAGHPVHSMKPTRIWVNDIEWEVNEYGYVTDQKFTGLGGAAETDNQWKYNSSTEESLLRVSKYIGDQTGDAYNAEGQAPSGTTTDFIGLGLSYMIVSMTYDPEVFDSVPLITTEVLGKKVYDPFSGGTGYSDNAARCILDYLESEYGLNVDTSYTDRENGGTFDIAATDCDTDAGSRPNNRFRCNGVLSTADSHQKNLEKLLSSCDGTLIFSGGKWKLLIGKDRSSTATTLTLDNMRGPIKVQTKSSKAERYNEVVGLFVDEDKRWLQSTYPVVTGNRFGEESDFLQADGGQVNRLELSLPMTTGVATAQRLAKINLFKSREEVVVNVRCDLTAIDLDVGDWVKLVIDRYGWTNAQNKYFEVKGYAMVFDEGAPQVDLILREISAAVYDWDADEIDIITDDIDTFSIANIVDSLDSLTTPSATASGYFLGDGTYQPTINLTWTGLDDVYVDGYQVRYYVTSDGISTATTVTLGRDATFYRVLTDGESEYTISLRAFSERTMGSYKTITQVSAKDTTAPGVPSISNIIKSDNKITVEFVPPSDQDVAHVDIFRVDDSRNIAASTGFGAMGSSPSGSGETVTDPSLRDSPVTPDANTEPSVSVDATPGRTGYAVFNNVDNERIHFFFLRSRDYSGNTSDWSSVVRSIPEEEFQRGATKGAPDVVNDPAYGGNGKIKVGLVVADSVEAGAITTEKLDAGAVTAEKIEAGAITAVAIGAGEITTEKLDAGAVTAEKITVDDLAAINADLGAITAGTLQGGSIPNADAAPVDAETGAFLDLTNGKFVFGNATKNILFDGTNFTLNGEVIVTQNVEDGAINADKISVTSIASINANLGDITAGTLKGGSIPDADAAPELAETGSFFDLTNGKFVVGNATNNLLFDGTNLSITGDIIVGANIADGEIDENKITVSNLAAINADLGDITAGTLKGGTTPPEDANSAPSGTESGSFFDLTGGKFVVGNATDNLLFDGTNLSISGEIIGTDNIQDNAVNQDKISVTNLSAINADLGAVTAGTLQGGATPPANADAAPSGSESGSFFDLTNGKFVVGDATNNLLFDGTSLSISGDIVGTDNIQDNAVNQDKISVTDLAAINADLGAITAGTLQGGATPPEDANSAPSAGEAGAFLDLTGGKFVFGDETSSILYDGTNLKIDGQIITNIGGASNNNISFDGDIMAITGTLSSDDYVSGYVPKTTHTSTPYPTGGTRDFTTRVTTGLVFTVDEWDVRDAADGTGTTVSISSLSDLDEGAFIFWKYNNFGTANGERLPEPGNMQRLKIDFGSGYYVIVDVKEGGTGQSGGGNDYISHAISGIAYKSSNKTALEALGTSNPSSVTVTILEYDLSSVVGWQLANDGAAEFEVVTAKTINDVTILNPSLDSIVMGNENTGTFVMGQRNVIIGPDAGSLLDSGGDNNFASSNVFIGFEAGNEIETGRYNVAIGRSAGDGAGPAYPVDDIEYTVSIGDGASALKDNNIAIGAGASVDGTDSIGIGRNVTVSSNNQVVIGSRGTHNQIILGDYILRDGISDGTNLNEVFHDAYHPNADTWTTARTFTLTGDVTGSASVDGSADVSISTTVDFSGITTLGTDVLEIGNRIEFDDRSSGTSDAFAQIDYSSSSSVDTLSFLASKDSSASDGSIIAFNIDQSDGSQRRIFTLKGDSPGNYVTNAEFDADVYVTPSPTSDGDLYVHGDISLGLSTTTGTGYMRIRQGTGKYVFSHVDGATETDLFSIDTSGNMTIAGSLNTNGTP